MIEGFYHDCSLLFDDDGKRYIVYGNRQIWLTELKEDLSGPLEGGLHRMLGHEVHGCADHIIGILHPDHVGIRIIQPCHRVYSRGEENIYGKGMWAASLRWHEGIYYVCFVANDTQKTYLYTAGRPEGPWEKHVIETGFIAGYWVARS